MRKAYLTACTALAAFAAACSSGVDTESADTDGDGSVSVSEAAKAFEASGQVKPQAGQYKATITMGGMDMPGMPEEMAGHGQGFTTTTEYCLTQEEVDEGFESMMKEGQDGDCSYERFDLSGGVMDAVMVCKSAEGDMRMEFNGKVTETTSDIEATMTSNMDGMGEGTMTFKAKHERVGDCPSG